MSVRVGHIMRHEDVHGVSGVGKVADVFEASNGVCIVVWRSAHSSTNVYPNIKALEATHSHGGKTLVIWDWESPPDPDPMEKAGEVAEAPLSEEELEEIADEATQVAQATANARVAEKMAEKAKKTVDPEVGPVEDEPTQEKE